VLCNDRNFLSQEESQDFISSTNGANVEQSFEQDDFRKDSMDNEQGRKEIELEMGP
jgi:hypothetical protein